MMNPKYKDVLIYDLECATVGDDPDPNTDKMRVFGAYSYKTDKYYVVPVSDGEFIQKMIDSHKFLVGFNNRDYDNVILKRFNFNLEYKRIIDLRLIIKNRAGAMQTKKGMLRDELMKYSLDYITRFLDLVDDDSAKGSLDYNILKKSSWTKEDIKKIKTYTERDIEITKKLYEWLEDYFDAFRDFVSDEDVRKKYYLTDDMAKFGYKADCHALGWEPVYFTNNDGEREKIRIGGGYCAYPAGEMFKAKIINEKEKKYEDIIVQLDFSSLYPSIMIQANLHKRVSNGDGWSGGDIIKVNNTYDNKELSMFAKLLRKWYFLRLYYKRKLILEDGNIIKFNKTEQFIGKKYYHMSEERGKFDLELITITEDDVKTFNKLFDEGVDPREYTIKILLNLQYGLFNEQYYSLIYDPAAGDDCTYIGRQMVKYARKVFREHGYPLINSDTDSWYFIDVYNDKNKYLMLKNKVIEDIKSSLPFPQITFDADIDAEIKYIFFFKGKNEDKESDKEMDEDDFINKPKGLMKKNYVYVTTDNKVVIKNLGIKKKSISALSKKIFWDYMVPQIKAEGKIKFSKVEIDNVMKEYLQKDINLATMRKEVKNASSYKSDSSIQAQISKKYGPGIHFMIPNVRHVGVGGSMTYCTDKEFNEYNMSIIDIDFTNFWKELDYFIQPVKQFTLFDV